MHSRFIVVMRRMHLLQCERRLRHTHGVTLRRSVCVQAVESDMGQMIHTIRHSTSGKPKLAKIYGPEAYAKGLYILHLWPADTHQEFRDYKEAHKAFKHLAHYSGIAGLFYRSS